MTITYGITEEKYSLKSIDRTSYGIAAYADTETCKTAGVLTSVHDITSNKKALTALVDNCNRLELSSVHLKDVVEDFLSK